MKSNNVFFNLDYDEYSLTELVEQYFDKIINVAITPKMQDGLKKMKSNVNVTDQLLDLFKGKGYNTKTKKSDLYSSLEKRVKNILFVIQTITNNCMKLTAIESDMREFPIEEVERCYQTVAMTSFMLNNAIKCKLIYRYEKLLPKRRTKDFKEKYPLLESCFKSYEQYKINEESEENYIKIHNNEGISDTVQNLHKCNEPHEDEYENIEVKYITPKGSLIQLDVDTHNGVDFFDVSNQAKDLIGPKQAQLIVYIMSLVFEQNKPEDVKKGCNVDINVKEYCKLKSIEWRSDVADEIYEDIKKLQKIIIEYEYTGNKGKKSTLRKSSLFSNRGIIEEYKDDGETIDKQVVKISLGAWMETLSYDQFQFINKAFFKYKLKNQNGTLIPISYYINSLHRNNVTKNKTGEYKTKVKNLTEKLNISESTIKAKGYKKALKLPLENILNIIGEGEGFNWKYKNGVHNSRKDFEDDVIIFNNVTLNRLYIEKGLAKKEAKKK